MPIRRPSLAVLAALACAVVLVACTPTPEPKVEPLGGRVVAVQNLSRFYSSVAAGLGDCSETVEQLPEEDDFESVEVAVDIMCTAIVDEVAHSARIDADAVLSFEQDGPDDGLSAVRFASRVVSNRSATGLSGATTIHQVILRFDVEDEPVAFAANAALTCHDSFYDFMRLRDLNVPFTSFDAGAVFLEGCQGSGTEAETGLAETGTLPVGSYELHVELYTLDWFTEEIDFAITFGE